MRCHVCFRVHGIELRAAPAAPPRGLSVATNTKLVGEDAVPETITHMVQFGRSGQSVAHACRKNIALHTRRPYLLFLMAECDLREPVGAISES